MSLMAMRCIQTIKRHGMMHIGRCMRFNRQIHRFYCYSRSERNCLRENFEQVNFKDVKTASRLFLSGKDASRIFAIFSPELNFEYIINNEKEISEDVRRRKVEIDVPALIENLKIIKELKEQINDINIARDRNALNASAVCSIDMTKLETLRKEGKELKNKLKALNESLWNFEDATLPELAKLPNSVHSDTPSQSEVLTKHGIVNEFPFHVKSHVEIGKLSQTLKFNDTKPFTYYLYNLAAVLELAVSNYFCDTMRHAGFRDVINPDFCKSVILEGCGRSLQVIPRYVALKEHQLDGHPLVLTGSASLEGYITTLSRIIVNNTSLPLQYFSVGRCYNPIELTEQSLFSVVQALTVTAFVASVESESMDHFSFLVNIIDTSYKNINLPVRSVKVPAHLLKPAESLRVEFDLWSPYKNEFVNVAHVSLCTDYISRRLIMKHGVQRTAEAYLFIVEATVTSIPVLIGCIMENNQTAEGNFSVPDIFKPYVNGILKV